MRRKLFNGKADRFMRKNGKLARQLDAKTRESESTVRTCGYKHTDKGWDRINNGARHNHKH